MFMETVPASSTDYIIVLLITIAMMVVSQIFSRKFGGSFSQQIQNQERIKAMQQELMEARNDPVRMQQIQGEYMKLMNDLMKKQMLPMCLRSGIFLGIFFIMNSIFSGKTFDANPIKIFGPTFASLYFMYSIGIMLIIYLVKYIMKKVRPTQNQSDKEQFIDNIRALQSNIKIPPPQSYRNDLYTEEENIYKPKISIDKENLSENIKKIRESLIEKRSRGELPADIDIDAEIEQMRIAQNNSSSLNNQLDLEETNNWKKKLKGKNP